METYLATVDLARLWPGMTWLDFGPYRLDSTWGPDNSAGRGLEPTLLNLWPELSWLNLDRVKSKSNPKCNLDNQKMYPI